MALSLLQVGFITIAGQLTPHFAGAGETVEAACYDDLAVAETWFRRARDEALSYDNETFAINIRANLGRIAQALGDADQAEELLTAALNAIPVGSALYLRSQVQLWLAELYIECNDGAAAGRHLHAARRRLVGSQRMGLQAQAEAIASHVGRIDNPPSQAALGKAWAEYHSALHKRPAKQEPSQDRVHSRTS